MKMNILTLAITLTVGIILAGSLLMPVISDATTTEKTFENEGYYYMTNLEDPVEYSFDGTKWTINGEDATIPISQNITLVAGDGIIIRTDGAIRGFTNISATAMTITVSSTGIAGTATVGGNSQTVEITATIYYCAFNEKTAYTLSEYNTPVYVHANSEILGDGMAGVKSGSLALFKIEGNITDGFTVTTSAAGITISNVESHYSPVEGYINLYKLDSITFTTTHANGTPDDPSDDIVINQTFSSYVVPSEVTSELSQHLSDGEIALLNALPVLIIVALVVMAAGALYLKRED